MSQIDLKRCTIKMKDGYSKIGAVNNVAGYSTTATTMLVDGFTGALVNGDTFFVAGDTVEHTITAHTETTGNTTSITFTPGLGANVVDNAVVTVGPHYIEAQIGEGTLSYTEKKPRVYVKDRGQLGTVRDGDEEPMDVKLDFIWEFLKASSGDAATFEDALKQRGGASAWVTSATDTCEPYAIDIEITYDPNCTDIEDEVILLPDFRYEQIDHDFKQGMLSVTGKCNAQEATVTRQA